ncbi:phage major capsid protein [Rhodococcus sp. ACPA1]|uniref:phage major capsid protein n=1 Tax=Rhodococcus sp. ACPA1 TaxID=2028572 RepID=UPI000BB0DBA9|nr:phage major capsid protein [Rhodococcus sp. ACPA1]PBC57033.1 phage major capsid protein [Rhodococcus sp. ACPA1]
MKTLDQLRAEYREHETRARAVYEAANGADIEGDDAATFDEATGAMDALRPEIRATEQRIEHIRQFAQNNPECIEHGDGCTSASTPRDNQPVSARDTALRVLERSVQAHDLDEDAAGRADTLLRHGDRASQSLAARWVTATGNPAYAGAFSKMCGDAQRGHLLWTPEEAAAYRAATEVRAELSRGMTVGGDGAMMVPLHLDPSILLSNKGSQNPLRRIARVVQITGSSWRGVSSAGATAQWVPEATEVADASPTLTQPEVPVHKGDAFVPFSFELGDDAPTFLSELQAVLVDSADQLQAEAFTTGSGNGQPTGVITKVASTPGSIVNATTAETFTAADVFAVQNSLGPRWQPNAQWTANLGIINAARQFETTNGAAKFPEIATGQLLGRALNENSGQDASIDPAVSAANFVLLYGDFAQFLIVDRIGTTIEVVPHLFGANRRPTLERGGLLWFRTGSDVLIPDAFRLLSVATAATTTRKTKASVG